MSRMVFSSLAKVIVSISDISGKIKMQPVPISVVLCGSASFLLAPAASLNPAITLSPC